MTVFVPAKEVTLSRCLVGGSRPGGNLDTLISIGSKVHCGMRKARTTVFVLTGEAPF
jgi:hypothetical protein